MYLILDLETNGLPYSINESIKKKKKWPNIIQISWQLHNKTGKLISKKNYIIYPKNHIINNNSYKIHKINNYNAKKYGYNIKYIFNILNKDILKTKYIIGYNLIFDMKIILYEYNLNNLKYDIYKKIIYIDLLKNFNFYKKWLSLKEIYKKIFKKNIYYIHNSQYDTLYTSRIFFYLIKNNKINYIKYNIDINDINKIKIFNGGYYSNKIIINNYFKNSYINNKKFFYAPLHNYTNYSLLISNTKIKKLIYKIYKNKINYFSVIERGNLMSLYKIYNYVLDFNKKYNVNIKYIIGIEFFIYTNNNYSKAFLHPFLVKNQTGYKNILKLCFYSKNINNVCYINKKYIKKYHKGLIALSGNNKSKFFHLIKKKKYKKFIEEILWWKNIYKKNFYIEIFNHNNKEKKINKIYLNISKKYNIKYIVQNINYFLKKKDIKIYNLLYHIKNKLKIINNIQIFKKDHYFKNKNQIYLLFYKKYKKGFNNLKKLISKIKNYNIYYNNKLIDYKIPKKFLKKYNNISQYKYLKYLIYKNYTNKFKNINNEKYLNRIKYELKVIKSIKFSNYFLIIKEIIDKAKKINVFIGPGRGSVNGSLIAYLLNITAIDPIKYKLLFERFLNKDRKTLPDIDIDFDFLGRKKILKWIYKKYGYKHVCNIITYNHLNFKSSIRSLTTIYNYSSKKTNNLLKILNKNIFHINNIINNNLYNKHIIYKKLYIFIYKIFKKKKIFYLLKKALSVKNIIKTIGIHACGILITRKKIYKYLPVIKIKKKKYLTQYNSNILQNMNLLKMDFLSLHTLSIIKNTLKDIKKNVFLNMSMHDKKVFNLFKKGETKGIFQFESSGIKNFLIKMVPNDFNDLIALNALYRPGPMKYIDIYIYRKKKKSKIKYEIPIMEKYLKNTYGIIIYQEQVMLLARAIASFTKKESDILRIAMGKKNVYLLNKMKMKFIRGGMKNNYNKDKLCKVWDNWKDFAHYAFNKSHSTSYAYLSYQTAFLKTHYNFFYIKNLLNYNIFNLTYINKIIRKYKKYYNTFMPLNLNNKNYNFKIKKKKILFGLGVIKGIGKFFINKIKKIIRKKGNFKSFYMFLKNIYINLINNRNVKIFIYSSLLDFFFKKKINKFFIIKKKKIDILVLLFKKYNFNKNTKKFFLFNENNILKKKIKKILFNKKKKKYNLGFSFIKEKYVNGISLINNIYNLYKNEICFFNIKDMRYINKYYYKINKIYGVIIKIIKNNNYYTITIEDNFFKYDFIIYNDKYLLYKKYIKKYYVIYLEIKIINIVYYIIYINLLKKLFNKMRIIFKKKNTYKLKIYKFFNNKKGKKITIYYSYNNINFIKKKIFLNIKNICNIKKIIKKILPPIIT
ncbi:MAG: DNA polymerase III subunit alpha [Candidatus Shikimatogenerans sp. Tduv]|uniref:DNA polymerase III subunit alpha n=1 Tax=Candidatus Shikimatogenerans sp. Tduv TaxID=3158567 RepID=A0AAU7QRI3_9FLAO